MWTDTRQDARTMVVVEGPYDSGFTPEAEAMLAAVEAYVTEHRELCEAGRKQPGSERAAGPDFRDQSPWVSERRA